MELIAIMGWTFVAFAPLFWLLGAILFWGPTKAQPYWQPIPGMSWVGQLAERAWQWATTQRDVKPAAVPSRVFVAPPDDVDYRDASAQHGPEVRVREVPLSSEERRALTWAGEGTVVSGSTNAILQRPGCVVLGGSGSVALSEATAAALARAILLPDNVVSLADVRQRKRAARMLSGGLTDRPCDDFYNCPGGDCYCERKVRP